MKLDFKRKCDKCGNIFSTAPFENMCADGESTYSSIEIYGDRYDLCPKCTWEIHNLIKNGRIDKNE